MARGKRLSKFQVGDPVNFRKYSTLLAELPVCECTELTTTERTLYWRLLWYCRQETGTANPSHEAIGKAVGLKRRQVIKCFARLSEMGLIEKISDTGKSDVYRFLWSPVHERWANEHGFEFEGFVKMDKGGDVHSSTHQADPGDVHSSTHQDVHSSTHNKRSGRKNISSSIPPNPPSSPPARDSLKSEDSAFKGERAEADRKDFLDSVNPGSSESEENPHPPAPLQPGSACDEENLIQGGSGESDLGPAPELSELDLEDSILTYVQNAYRRTNHKAKLPNLRAKSRLPLVERIEEAERRCGPESFRSGLLRYLRHTSESKLKAAWPIEWYLKRAGDDSWDGPHSSQKSPGEAIQASRPRPTRPTSAKAPEPILCDLGKLAADWDAAMPDNPSRWDLELDRAAKLPAAQQPDFVRHWTEVLDKAVKVRRAKGEDGGWLNFRWIFQAKDGDWNYRRLLRGEFDWVGKNKKSSETDEMVSAILKKYDDKIQKGIQ